MIQFSTGFNYKEDPLSLVGQLLSISEDRWGKLSSQAYPECLNLDCLCVSCHDYIIFSYKNYFQTDGNLQPDYVFVPRVTKTRQNCNTSGNSPATQCQ